MINRLISVTGKRYFDVGSCLPFFETVNDLYKKKERSQIVVAVRKTLTHVHTIAREGFGKVLKFFGKSEDRQSGFPL